MNFKVFRGQAVLQVGLSQLQLRDVTMHDLELGREFDYLFTGASGFWFTGRGTRRQHITKALLKGRVLEKFLGERSRELVISDETRGIDLKLIEESDAGRQIIKKTAGSAGDDSAQTVELASRNPRAPGRVPGAHKGSRIEPGKARHGLLIEGTEYARLLIDPILHSMPG